MLIQNQIQIETVNGRVDFLLLLQVDYTVVVVEQHRTRRVVDTPAAQLIDPLAHFVYYARRANACVEEGH